MIWRKSIYAALCYQLDIGPWPADGAGYQLASKFMLHMVLLDLFSVFWNDFGGYFTVFQGFFSVFIAMNEGSCQNQTIRSSSWKIFGNLLIWWWGSNKKNWNFHFYFFLKIPDFRGGVSFEKQQIKKKWPKQTWVDVTARNGAEDY